MPQFLVYVYIDVTLHLMLTNNIVKSGFEDNYANVSYTAEYRAIILTKFMDVTCKNLCVLTPCFIKTKLYWILSLCWGDSIDRSLKQQERVTTPSGKMSQTPMEEAKNLPFIKRKYVSSGQHSLVGFFNFET